MFPRATEEALAPERGLPPALSTGCSPGVSVEGIVTARRDTMPAHRVLGLQPQFGGTPIGCASSTNFAAESIKGSENLGPTICRPTGSLAEVRPAGTLAAGSAASDTRKVGPIQSMYSLIFLPSTTSG